MSNYQNCSGNANCGNVQYEKVLWNEKSVLKSEYLRVACSHVDDAHRSFQQWMISMTQMKSVGVTNVISELFSAHYRWPGRDANPSTTEPESPLVKKSTRFLVQGDDCPLFGHGRVVQAEILMSIGHKGHS